MYRINTFADAQREHVRPRGLIPCLVSKIFILLRIWAVELARRPPCMSVAHSALFHQSDVRELSCICYRICPAIWSRNDPVMEMFNLLDSHVTLTACCLSACFVIQCMPKQMTNMLLLCSNACANKCTSSEIIQSASRVRKGDTLSNSHRSE